jgi:hypothetical protein
MYERLVLTAYLKEKGLANDEAKPLYSLVGAIGFEPTTPTPPV